MQYATDFAVDEVNGIETTYVEDRITGQLVERMHVDYKKVSAGYWLPCQ